MLKNFLDHCKNFSYLKSKNLILSLRMLGYWCMLEGLAFFILYTVLYRYLYMYMYLLSEADHLIYYRRLTILITIGGWPSYLQSEADHWPTYFLLEADHLIYSLRLTIWGGAGGFSHSASLLARSGVTDLYFQRGHLWFLCFTSHRLKRTFFYCFLKSY